MENNINEIPGSNDEISLKELIDKLRTFWKYLKTKWVIFFAAAIIGGLLGLAYYYLQSPKYTADCTFILEEKSSSGGGLAGLASQFGFDVGSMGGSSLFAGDNLLEIIPSRKIVESVLLTKVDSNTDHTLADLFLDFTNLKKSWANKPRLANVSFNKVESRNGLSLIQDSVLNVIYKRVTKNYLTVDWARKKASLIRVSTTSKDERFSKYLTERVVEASKKLYIDLKSGTAQANVNRLQRRADSILALLNNKSYQTASSQILNPNLAMREALVPTEISTRDKTVLGTLYAEVVKNLETSKILLSQQTPVIQIIDNPEFPLVNDKKGRMISVITGMFIMGLIVVVWFSAKYFLKSIK